MAEEYLKNKNFEKVNELVATVVLKDMIAEYLRGQLLINEGNYSEAFRVFDTAMGLKTFYATRADSTNVLYARAVAAQKVYESNKNKKDGEKAYYAWDSICKRYSGDKTNEHYKEAVGKMNLLYHTDKIFEIKIEPLKNVPIPKDTLKKPRRPWKVKQL